MINILSLVPVLSLVTSAKDYFEVIHKLMEFHPTYSASDYTEFGSFISYAVLTLKSSFIEILSFNWLQNIWSLPIIVPDIASAMISEVSVLDGYFHNAFTFLETPLSYGKENYSFYGLEKFTIGFINSFFLFLPTSAAHVIFFRRLVFQGIEGGYVAGIGIITGNILWLTSIIFGWRFFVIPWLSLDILRYLLGFVILIKFMWHASRDKRILTNFSKSKIFLINFLLAFTEQTNLYPFVTNMSVGAESSVLETFPVDNFGQFLFVHSAYILGLLAGSISLLNLTCWLWENPIAKIYYWLKSNIYMPNFFQYKNLNYFFLYLTMLCTISSFPYFGLDYTLTNPLGLVSDDRILYQKNKKTNQTEYPEISFLNSQASDRNARDSRGRHGRRERWKERLIKYKGMDTSLYNQGVYDLFSIEDLNYGFDKFWLRKRIRNHPSRFRMLIIKPQLLSLKKQLAKPRLLTNEGARVEVFRMIYELFYHPNFHAYSRQTNVVSPKQNASTGGGREKSLTLSSPPPLSPLGENEFRSLNQNKESPPLLSLAEEPRDGSFLKPLLKNNLENVNTFSALRKFIRKINTRIKSSEILLDKNNSKSLNKPIYSKRWKQVLSQKNSNAPAFNQNIQDRVIWEKLNPALLIHSKNLKMPLNELKETWQKTSDSDFSSPEGKKPFLNKDTFNHLSLSASNNMQKEKLSKKDRQILRYKTKLALFLPLTTKIFPGGRKFPSEINPPETQSGTKNAEVSKKIIRTGDSYSRKRLTSSDKTNIGKSPLGELSLEINNPKTMLHPIKFYLQKEKAFKRKFKFYGSSVFRKLSIENNAPYFRIMMKRLFYYYKPTLRWTNTFKLAKNKQGHKVRKKQSRTPLKIIEPQYSSFPKEANSFEAASEAFQQASSQEKRGSYRDFLPNQFGSSLDKETSYLKKENSNLLQKPTHHFRIAGKNSSRHRNLIFKQALFNWYYTPFNRILSKLDIDSFIRRQPNSHFLTKKDEQGLHLKRFLLADHYETLRWYTYMQHYRSMKTKIGGTKSFASKFVYNQQFQGTLKKVRHLFAITPSLFANKEPAVSSDGKSPFDIFSLSKPRIKTSSNNSNFESKDILKFDQPLYNEYSNSKKNSLLNDSVTHEELLSPAKINQKLGKSPQEKSSSSPPSSTSSYPSPNGGEGGRGGREGRTFPKKSASYSSQQDWEKSQRSQSERPILNGEFLEGKNQSFLGKEDDLGIAQQEEETALALLSKNPYTDYKENLTRQKEDFIALSTSIVREYLKTAKPIRQATIKEFLLKKNYKELTKFILTGQKIRGIKAITNQRLLINQERFYLFPNTKSGFSLSLETNKNPLFLGGRLGQKNAPVLTENRAFLENTQLIEFFKKTANNLNIEQDMWFSLLKTYKKGLYDKEFIAKFLDRRTKRREKRYQKKEKELEIRLKRLQKWLAPSPSTSPYGGEGGQGTSESYNKPQGGKWNLLQELPLLRNSQFQNETRKILRKSPFGSENYNSTLPERVTSRTHLLRENGLLTTGLKNAIKNSVPSSLGVAEQENDSYRNKSSEDSVPTLEKNLSLEQTEPIFTQLKEKKNSIFNKPAFSENNTLFKSTKSLILGGFIKTKVISQVLKNKIQEILNLLVKEPVLFLKLKPITRKKIRSWDLKDKMFKNRKGSRKKYPKEIKKAQTDLAGASNLNGRISTSVFKNNSSDSVAYNRNKFEKALPNRVEFDRSNQFSLISSEGKKSSRKEFFRAVLNRFLLIKTKNNRDFFANKEDYLVLNKRKTTNKKTIGSLRPSFNSDVNKINAQEKTSGVLDPEEQERQKNISNADTIGTDNLKKKVKNKTSVSFLYFNTLFQMGEKYEIKQKFRLRKSKNRRNQRFGRPHRPVEHPSKNPNLERRSQNMIPEKRVASLKEALLPYLSSPEGSSAERFSYETDKTDNSSKYSPGLTAQKKAPQEFVFLSKKIKSKKSNKFKWKKLKKSINTEKARKARKQNIDAVAVHRAGALTKQIKRIQLNLKLQQWWWLAFGQPNFQATAEANWQFEKDRHFEELIAKLSKTEVLLKDGDFVNSQNSRPVDSDVTKKALSLQIGNYDFKPLAIPQALRIRDNLIHQNFLLKKLLYSNSRFVPPQNKESSQRLLAFFSLQNSEELAVLLERSLVDKKALPILKVPTTTNLINRLYMNIFDLTFPQKTVLSNQTVLLGKRMVSQKKARYSQLTQSVRIKIQPEKLYSKPLLAFIMRNRIPSGPDTTQVSIGGQFQNQKEVSPSLATNGVKPESKFFINTNPLPFYAGWDESLRKFVVTNRLLSRRDAGYSATLLSSMSSSESQSNPQGGKLSLDLGKKLTPVSKIEFTNAPLQGMNAGTTLYCQVPFTTFDPDQLFAKGMDGFAPIGWRRFEFTHTIFKTKALTRWLSKTNGALRRPIKPLLIKNISRKQLQPIHSNLIHKLENRGAKLNTPAEFYKMNYDTIKRSNNYSRRLQRHYKRTRTLQNAKAPVFLMSGPLIHQVLPVNYINIFNKQNRLSKDRYVKRRLRRGKKVVPKTVKEFNTFFFVPPTGEEKLPSTFSLEVPIQKKREIFDFTFRRRLKTRRKYHRKSVFPKGIEVRPRRHKFLADFDETQTQNQNQQESFRSKKLMRKRPTKRRSKRKDASPTSKIKTNSALNSRLRQLRRRISRQVIKTVPRRRPQAGGFVWPGDYLRLATTESPKLVLKNEKSNFLRKESKSDTKKEAETSLDTTTLINEKQQITRKITKKAILLDLYVQPRKYLLEKHNMKILKKKLEKAQRTNQIKQRVKEFQFSQK